MILGTDPVLFQAMSPGDPREHAPPQFPLIALGDLDGPTVRETSSIGLGMKSVSLDFFRVNHSQ